MRQECNLLAQMIRNEENYQYSKGQEKNLDKSFTLGPSFGNPYYLQSQKKNPY